LEEKTINSKIEFERIIFLCEQMNKAKENDKEMINNLINENNELREKITEITSKIVLINEKVTKIIEENEDLIQTKNILLNQLENICLTQPKLLNGNYHMNSDNISTHVKHSNLQELSSNLNELEGILKEKLKFQEIGLKVKDNKINNQMKDDHKVEQDSINLTNENKEMNKLTFELRQKNQKDLTKIRSHELEILKRDLTNKETNNELEKDNLINIHFANENGQLKRGINFLKNRVSILEKQNIEVF